MENILLFVFILTLLEFVEIFIQQARTLYGVMQKLYVWYEKSIFLFFLVHPTFYFILFVVISTEVMNGYIVSILVLKIFDLFYKMELMKKIFIKQELSKDLESMLAWKIPFWFFLMGVGLYPPLLFYAFMG